MSAVERSRPRSRRARPRKALRLRSGTAHVATPRAAVEDPTIKLSREGCIYLGFTGIFALTAFALGDNLVFLMGCLLLGSAYIARRVAKRNLVGLDVERHLPARMRVGRPGTIRWTVGAKGTTHTGLEVRDRMLRSARPRQVTIDAPHVQAHDAALCSTSLVFTRRGRMRLGPVQLESRFPIGLFHTTAKATVGNEVLVWPREGRPGTRLFDLLRGEALAREQRTQGDDAFYGVREMREGDDPRRIHWRSSARRGALVVSQWRAESGREVWIVLPRGRAAGRGAETDFERAVSVAATIWRSAIAAQLDVRLILGTRTDAVRSRSGRRLAAGLDALATVARRRGRRPIAALRRLEARSPRPRTVIYVATQPDPAADRRATARGRARWVTIPAHDAKAVRTWIRGLR